MNSVIAEKIIKICYNSPTFKQLNKGLLMKKLLMIVLMSAFGVTAFANGAGQEEAGVGGDQEKMVYKCAPEVAHPDLGMSLELTTGGLTGLSKIHVSRYMLGHSESHVYYVRMMPVRKQPIGGPTIYKGNKVSFSINGLRPTSEGKLHASLVTKQGKSESVELLLCDDLRN